MLQIIGKPSPSKRQFVFTMGQIFALHYGNYEIHTENFQTEDADYFDNLAVLSLRDYTGQDRCILEQAGSVIHSAKTVYYLTPFYHDVMDLKQYVGKEQPKNLIVVFGDHIWESEINIRYIERMVAELSPETELTIHKIEWDRINKLISDEALFDGYYEIASLSKEYKNAIIEMAALENIAARDLKKHFKWKRRVAK